jgi:hypothetical protein
LINKEKEENKLFKEKIVNDYQTKFNSLMADKQKVH